MYSRAYCAYSSHSTVKKVDFISMGEAQMGARPKLRGRAPLPAF